MARPRIKRPDRVSLRLAIRRKLLLLVYLSIIMVVLLGRSRLLGDLLPLQYLHTPSGGATIIVVRHVQLGLGLLGRRRLLGCRGGRRGRGGDR